MSSSIKVNKSTKKGAHHWWHQRLSAIGLALTGILVIFCLVSVLGQDYAAARDAFASPFAAAVSALFLLLLFYHATLGLQTIVEDYVSSRGYRLVILVLVKLACLAATVFGLVSLFMLLV